jgi:hypothetical protein
MNKTAVDWIFDQMPDGYRLTRDAFEAYTIAKEMEKQQIINSYEDWPVATRGCQNGLEYYEANYGGKDA